MTVYAEFRGSEMTIHFSAETEKWDYGVPGSPTFEDVRPDSIEVRSIEILGEDFKLSDLPEKLQAAILALADDLEFSNE